MVKVKITTALIAFLFFTGCDNNSETLSASKEFKIVQEILPFAIMSELAYDRNACEEDLSDSDNKIPKLQKGWERVDRGYIACPDKKSRTDSLRFQIWHNKKQKLVVIAFRGTDDMHDWWSNLKPMNKAVAYRLATLANGPNPYEITADLLIKLSHIPFMDERNSNEFITKVKEWIRQLDTQYEEAPRVISEQLNEIIGTQDVSIYTTGHSLGGGLAEALLYSSQCENSSVPKIEKAYVFNASPITKASIHRSCLDEFNFTNVTRTEDRGELLSPLRDLKEIAQKPPEVRTLTCDFPGRGQHSMSSLVVNLSKLSSTQNSKSLCSLNLPLDQ